MSIGQTSRTIIRKIELTDAPFFVELMNSPPFLRYIGDRNVRNEADAAKYLTNGMLKSYEQFGYGYYVVRTLDEQPIGICGFLKKSFLDNVDFGFAFLPEYQGQGFGSEAGEATLQYGIQQYAFKALDAVTVPANRPSIGLLQKLGFAFQSERLQPETEEQLLIYRWKASTQS